MAPYSSDAQRRKFHALLKEGKISKRTVSEYDKASKGMKLPERVTPKKKFTSIDQVREYAKKK